MPFQFHRVAVRGRKCYGCIATINIRKGTQIHPETPLIRIPEEVKLDLEKMSHEFDLQLYSLPPDQRRQILSLSHDFKNCDSKPDPKMTYLTSILLTNFIAGESKREKTRENFADWLISPDYAHFNYSCDPNAITYWEGRCGRQVVVNAMTDIKEGEEITIGLDSEKWIESRYERRKKRRLARGGFWCLCEVCDMPSEEVLKSDERCREIGQLLPHIEGHVSFLNNYPLGPESEAVEYLQSCKRVTELLKEDCPNSQDLRLALLVCKPACAVCVAHGDLARAAAFVDLELKATIVICGPNAENVEILTHNRDHPELHHHANKTDRWKTRAEDRNEAAEAGFEKWLWERATTGAAPAA